MMYLCLVVQHDAAPALAPSRDLVKLGLKSYCVSSVPSAQRLLGQWRFDIVLVNTQGFGERIANMLPELKTFGLPIVAMTGAPLAEEAQIRALELGASEVVTTSDSTYLLALKLRKLVDVRREAASGVPPAQLRLGPLVLDGRRVRASVGEVSMDLTPRQFDLLWLLTVQAGEFVHRRAISTALRQRGDEGSRSVDMMISRIRRRLRELGDTRLVLHTIYGCGYCLTFEEQPEDLVESALPWSA